MWIMPMAFTGNSLSFFDFVLVQLWVYLSGRDESRPYSIQIYPIPQFTGMSAHKTSAGGTAQNHNPGF